MSRYFKGFDMPGRKNELLDNDATDFFAPFEDQPIESLQAFNNTMASVYEIMTTASAAASASRRRFAFRGVVNASWPLHSSLYRRLCWRDKKPVSEERLRDAERNIMANVHRWGLHRTVNRLSMLEQLAMLQHYGAPTRLIDITFNAYAALWFAIERDDKGTDGRFFIFDVTDRLINEDDQFRAWEHSLQAPWTLTPPSTGAVASYNDAHGIAKADWTARVWAWEPSSLEPRISAQQGAFLFGGVPSSSTASKWRKPSKDYWGINDVRRSTSVSLRFHHLARERGFRSNDAAYTIRVKASCKKRLRDELLAIFGYSHGRMFPDFPGFREHGTPDLPQWVRLSGREAWPGP